MDFIFLSGENINLAPHSQGASCTSMNACPQTGSMICYTDGLQFFDLELPIIQPKTSTRKCFPLNSFNFIGS